MTDRDGEQRGQHGDAGHGVRAMKARIYLKGGAVIEAPMRRFAVKKNMLGDVREMEWEAIRQELSETLLYLDIDQVAAVTTIDEPGIGETAPDEVAA